MTLTTFPATTDSSDLAILNLSQLLTRLEHNLISPNADLKSLRRSEYQRMRVGANIEYARTHLQSLERTLPQTKPVDRRHEIQSDLSRSRQTLKRLQNALDQIKAESGVPSSHKISQQQDPHTPLDTEDESESESLNGIEEDLLATPEDGSTTDEGSREELTTNDVGGSNEEDHQLSDNNVVNTKPPTTTSTQPTVSSTDATLSTSAGIPTEIATLRNRHHSTQLSPSTTATGTSFHTTATVPAAPSSSPQQPESTSQSAEQAITLDRVEQENLTSSLLSLATQLKMSSHAFQASLESEKSVLNRAVDGLDRTTGNMQAAERRMGMLRRMTEGRGWWGRMMLYAWIVALWVVAVLIVFVGPKLRF